MCYVRYTRCSIEINFFLDHFNDSRGREGRRGGRGDENGTPRFFVFRGRCTSLLSRVSFRNSASCETTYCSRAKFTSCIKADFNTRTTNKDCNNFLLIIRTYKGTVFEIFRDFCCNVYIIKLLNLLLPPLSFFFFSRYVLYIDRLNSRLIGDSSVKANVHANESHDQCNDANVRLKNGRKFKLLLVRTRVPTDELLRVYTKTGQKMERDRPNAKNKKNEKKKNQK